MNAVKKIVLPWVLALALSGLMLFAGHSKAAPAAISGPIACMVSSPVYSTSYSPFTTGNTSQALTLEVTCSRSTDLVATTVVYRVKSLQGNQPAGGSNRAVLAGSPNKYINYDLYIDSNCSILWKGTTNYIENTNLVLAAGATSATAQHTFYACIPQQTMVVFGNAYVDSPVLNLVHVSANPGNPNVSQQTDGNLQVSINVPKTCNISTPPGTVNFGNYVAFGPAKTASATFGVTCTNQATYEMSITDNQDRPIASGVLAGLRYDLSLSATNDTGRGTEKRHQINGTMAAKQPGSCANSGCVGEQSNKHKLVVTY
jgi:spore coat protein U-like protein